MESQSPRGAESVRRNAADHIVGRSRHCFGDAGMNTSLLELMEELLRSIEQREAGDPDAPAWEASARIQRLEAELARRLSDGDADAEVPPAIQVRPSDEVLAGV